MPEDSPFGLSTFQGSLRKPENTVALGFVEGVNNKICVIQRWSAGLRDEAYLRLKVLTCMLDPI